jgi:hypothetical protein
MAMGAYSQHFFSKCNLRMGTISWNVTLLKDKHSSLSGPFLSYEKNCGSNTLAYRAYS